MPVRFQADADFNQIIVAAVVRRTPEIDFRTATAAGLAGVDDAAVLAIAAQDGRILVTHDQTTMPTHFGEFTRSKTSPGLIVVPQSLAIREAADSLILIWAATGSEEWINQTRICRSDLNPGLPKSIVFSAAQSLRRSAPPFCGSAWARQGFAR
jgi:hypothetical protein